MERERGSVTMWMIGVVALAALIALLLIRESAAAVDDGRAQGIADLAALAGVTGARAAAVEVAARNGATVVRYGVEDGVVDVVIRRDGVEAGAHATEGEMPT